MDSAHSLPEEFVVKNSGNKPDEEQNTDSGNGMSPNIRHQTQVPHCIRIDDGETTEKTYHVNGINTVWQKYQFPIILLALQALFMVLMGIWGRYQSDTLPEGVGNMNEINSKYPMFQDIHIMVYIGFGFLMTFLKRYGYSSISLNLLIACVTVEWAIILRGFIFYFNQRNKFHFGLEMLIDSDFIAATVLISMGAMLGKFSPVQYVLMAIVEVPLALGIEHVVIETMKVNDVGGSLTIHCFGAYFGLACSADFAKKPQRHHENEGSIYHSDLFAMIGTIFLWCYWPSFNAADAEFEDSRQRAVANTYLSLMASTVTTFIITYITNPERKFDMVHIANATLAGGVAIGTIANVVLYPLDAMIIGAVAGFVSTMGFKYLTPFLNDKLGLHDTCGVHNLHGMPAVISGITSCILAVAYDINDYGKELHAVYPGITRRPDGSYNAQWQAVHQFVGLLIVWGAGLGGGAITGFLLRLPVWNQVADAENFSDLDYFETPGDFEFTTKLSANVKVNDVLHSQWSPSIKE